MHCDPAASIIKLVGGLSLIAKAAGTTVTTAQRWRLPREKGGTGGFIPRKYHSGIVAAAAATGIELPLAAFVDAAAVPHSAESA